MAFTSADGQDAALQAALNYDSEPPQPLRANSKQQRRWIGADGMVKGAGGEHQDKRQTINQQRELFDGAAPTENEQRSQTHYGEQCRNQMYPGTDRVTKFTHETYPIGPRKFTPG